MARLGVFSRFPVSAVLPVAFDALQTLLARFGYEMQNEEEGDDTQQRVANKSPGGADGVDQREECNADQQSSVIRQ